MLLLVVDQRTESELWPIEASSNSAMADKCAVIAGVMGDGTLPATALAQIAKIKMLTAPIAWAKVAMAVFLDWFFKFVSWSQRR